MARLQRYRRTMPALGDQPSTVGTRRVMRYYRLAVPVNHALAFTSCSSEWLGGVFATSLPAPRTSIGAFGSLRARTTAHPPPNSACHPSGAGIWLFLRA